MEQIIKGDKIQVNSKEMLKYRNTVKTTQDNSFTHWKRYHSSCRDVPGGPGVKTLPSNAGSADPWWGS